MGCNSATAALTYSPGSFNFTLNLDQSASELLTITNSGEAESVLFYDVSIATPSPFESGIVPAASCFVIARSIFSSLLVAD